MVARLVVGVVVMALASVACGKASQPQGGTYEATSGASGASAGMPSAAGGANAGSGGRAVAGGGQAGAALTGIGDGELDSTCMMRTNAHLAGERITLRSAVTAEGDKTFIGFYDNEQQAECDVVMDAEGKYRCMPPAYDKDMINRFFLDDKCSDEVQYQGLCALDHQAEPVSSDPCDERRRIYPFGEPLPDTMVYKGQPGGDCKPYSTLNRLHRRGPELVASEWAELKPALWRGKGRIWARGYEGEGGLHLVQSFVDSQLEQRCEFRVMPDGATHCAPNRLGSLSGYTDASCKQQLLDGSSLCGSPPPTYASYRPTDACKPGLSLMQARDRYTEPLYSRSSCMPAVNAEGPMFSTQPAPDSDFVTLSRSVATTDSGRLKPVYLTTSDGGCFFQEWWDEQLQTPCAFASQYAGAPYYCLPQPDGASLAQFVDAFSDADCKTPTPYAKLPGCAEAKAPKFLSTYEPSCVVGWRSVRSVDPAPTVQPFPLYVKVDGACQPYAPDTPGTYHAAGPLLPSSMFVQATPEP